MNRLFFGASLVCVLFLIVGTFVFPSSMIMELASTSWVATAIRFGMVAGLLSVLFTTPPRRLFVRLGMGGLAVALIATGIALSLGSGMHMLDVLLYLVLGCALGIEALEFNDDELLERAERLHEVYKTSQAGVKALS